MWNVWCMPDQWMFRSTYEVCVCAHVCVGGLIQLAKAWKSGMGFLLTYRQDFFWGRGGAGGGGEGVGGCDMSWCEWCGWYELMWIFEMTQVCLCFERSGCLWLFSDHLFIYLYPSKQKIKTTANQNHQTAATKNGLGGAKDLATIVTKKEKSRHASLTKMTIFCLFVSCYCFWWLMLL